MVISIISLTLV